MIGWNYLDIEAGPNNSPYEAHPKGVSPFSDNRWRASAQNAAKRYSCVAIAHAARADKNLVGASFVPVLCPRPRI